MSQETLGPIYYTLELVFIIDILEPSHSFSLSLNESFIFSLHFPFNKFELILVEGNIDVEFTEALNNQKSKNLFFKFISKIASFLAKPPISENQTFSFVLPKGELKVIPKTASNLLIRSNSN